MGYSLKWLVPEQLLQVRTWGNLTCRQLMQMNRAVMNCIEHSPAKTVHVMVDERHLNEVQGNLFEMQRASSMLYHPKAGWWVMVGEGHPQMNHLYNIMQRTEHLEHRRFDNLAVAAAFLIEHAPDLWQQPIYA